MRAWTAFDRALGALVVTSNNIGSLLIFAMTIGVVADVTGRYLFNSPINGTHEMVTIGVVAILYLQLSYTLRSGRMTRSDAILTRLATASPAISRLLNFTFNVAGACLAAAIVYGAWPKLLGAWREGFYVGVIGVFTFPEWPLYLIILIGCTLTGLQFLALTAADLLRRPGVPERAAGGAG
ncbi:MAG: TRAP transporter small permease [Alphaproteobacteria bacterium]|nr:TRAP transporter small permease [Alphaproteobacteria bacterium]